MTTFQKKVYDALCEIPEGKVVSYQTLAEHLGIRSSQAVGQALKKNPNSPEFPCHRVIKKNGHLGGFMGSLDNQKKRALLDAEGVIFDNEGILVTKNAWYCFKKKA